MGPLRSARHWWRHADSWDIALVAIFLGSFVVMVVVALWASAVSDHCDMIGLSTNGIVVWHCGSATPHP